MSEDDLVRRHVLDVVDRWDLTGFHARYRFNGQGGAAYDPAMMVALLMYAHASQGAHRGQEPTADIHRTGRRA